MDKVAVSVEGKSYPCRPTMGAMLLFKKETGKEITEIDGSLTDLCTYLWCCVVSACRHDKIDFDMDFTTFADSIDMADMAEWTNAIQSKDATVVSNAKDQKKSLK